jgi:hypothetical protein
VPQRARTSPKAESHIVTDPLKNIDHLPPGFE